MIVVCESCQTRFRLDDARVPAKGARVRCSRCKTSFVVHRPDASADEAIQEVVAEATQRPQAAPEPITDLDERTSGTRRSEPASEEDQWDFDDPPPALANAKQPGPQAQRAREDAPSEDGAPSLASLGKPDDWDFIGDSADRIAREATFRAPAAASEPEPRADREPEPAEPEGSVDQAVRGALARPASAPEAPSRKGSLRSTLDLAAVSAGWIAASALLAIGVAIALTPAELPTPPHGPGVRTLELSGASAQVVFRHVENAVSGELLVVNGQQVPRRAGPPLRLRGTWRDALGANIPGATTVAGPPSPERALRELSLETLRAEHAERAGELAAGGAYELVFGTLPAGAHTLTLAYEAAPPPPAPIAPPSEAATVSSRPSARPSSE